jgi:hypothetical protein
MKLREAFIQYLIKTLGYTKAKAEETIPAETEDSDFTEVLETINTAHKAKVLNQKETDFNEGHQKATLDTLTKREDEIREKYGIKSKKKGIELIDEVIAAQLPDPKNPEAISDDLVRKHPAFIKRESELLEAVETAKGETESKVKEVEDRYAGKETFSKVVDFSLKTFRGMKPVLPADADKAARQEARLIKELEASGLKFQLQGEGQPPLVLEADGKRKEDGHGNPIKYEDLIRGFADDLGFEFKAGDERSSSGGTPPGTTPPPVQGAKYTGKQPTNKAEYMAIITNSALPMEQRAEVQDAYEKQFV